MISVSKKCSRDSRNSCNKKLKRSENKEKSKETTVTHRGSMMHPKDKRRKKTTTTKEIQKTGANLSSSSTLSND